MKLLSSYPFMVGIVNVAVLVLLGRVVEASPWSLPSTHWHPSSLPLPEFNSTDLSIKASTEGTLDSVLLSLLCISLLAPLLCLFRGGFVTQAPKAAAEEASLLDEEETEELM
eukprot:gnl/MRDRNA2_/MRDRNA2_117850_c0_seq1.p1 gnl/MRDRNA2_/MRDRNA2_117850_c0~~gnl/MRDRNA2_/MRDRNA2_117850_c0_seq1.p1  ORF type:complete len:112 (+),score=20.49 gnl/MRDRNA2_/MRDRNA2_117850_c0_seq1:91-426(+)